MSRSSSRSRSKLGAGGRGVDAMENYIHYIHLELYISSIYYNYTMEDKQRQSYSINQGPQIVERYI